MYFALEHPQCGSQSAPWVGQRPPADHVRAGPGFTEGRTDALQPRYHEPGQVLGYRRERPQPPRPRHQVPEGPRWSDGNGLRRAGAWPQRLNSKATTLRALKAVVVTGA